MLNESMNIKQLFFYLSVRYNLTNTGVIKGTKNTPHLNKISAVDFTEWDLDYYYCVKKTENILRHNIYLIHDKKVAIGLSGGTDSSLNAILLSKNDKISLKCFCIGFNDADDEFDDARSVAQMVGCDYREIVIDDVVQDLPLQIWKFGAPKS